MLMRVFPITIFCPSDLYWIGVREYIILGRDHCALSRSSRALDLWCLPPGTGRGYAKVGVLIRGLGLDWYSRLAGVTGSSISLVVWDRMGLVFLYM